MIALRRFLTTNFATFLLLATVIAGSFIIYVDVRQSMHKAVWDPNDFVTLYAGAICTNSGCKPYSVPDLDTVLRQKRDTATLQDWTDQLPIYPPTTIFLLTPLARLSYQTATTVWYLLSLLIYGGGVLWLFLFSPGLRGAPSALRAIAVLLALHFPKMIQCLGFGNPSLIVTGLMLFAVFEEGDRRYLPRLTCATIAVWLKFTSALPLMLLVLFSDRTHSRRAWLALLAFGLATCGVVWYTGQAVGMQHWLSDVQQDIAIGEQNGMSPSAHISPSNVLLNAANLPGYFTRNPMLIFGFVLIAVGLLTAFLIIALLSRRIPLMRDDRYELAAAAVSIVSLLPVYHRFCDIGLLLFVLPWLIRRLSRQIDVLGVTVSMIMGLLYFSWERRINLHRFSGGALRTLEFFYYRGDALLVFTLAVILVCMMYRQRFADGERPAAA